jgi:pimeloyl-ACP methyl ester carboxylesterase
VQSITSLDIKGYGGQPVPNTLFFQDRETRHLAIVFPGFAYTADMPVLYYPGRLLVQRGADLLQVKYAYHQPSLRAISSSERARRLGQDVAAACEAGLAQRTYEQITLLGKSIGTLAMGQLVTTDVRFRDARCIWLTPLLTSGELRAQIKQGKQRGLFVLGTDDRYYDPAHLAEVVEATNGQRVVIEGADHSLEIAGDVVQSLRAIERVMRAIEAFLN